jgi:S-formylglutathione hydrolase FrmB
MRSLRLVLLMLCCALTALAQGRAECGDVPSKVLKRSVRYCALLPASFDDPASKSRKYPILYYLHGLGDNEQTLINSGAWSLIEDLRKQKKIGDFVIVTPQGDRTFYVNSADGKERYSDFFLQEFMPSIERKYRIDSARAYRGIDGVSMGGYGALRFAFAHPELFSSVAVHSAALMPAPPAVLNAGIRAGDRQALMFAEVFGDPIDVEHWQQNSPFVLARKNAATIRKLHIYFDCGDHDDFGFDSGAKLLDRELTGEHIAHEFHLYPGRHDLLYLLAHIGASIQFAAKNFAAAR